MKKEKILKIIIAILLILILLGVGLTEVIGNYFVNYAIARSGAGGDRKISQESTIEVLGEDGLELAKELIKKAEELVFDNIYYINPYFPLEFHLILMYLMLL